MPKKRDENAPYWVQMRQAERSIIAFAIEHGQTIRGTASILGISPNYLSERMSELGVAPPEVRPGPKPGTKPNRPQKPPALRVIPSNVSAPRALPHSGSGTNERALNALDEVVVAEGTPDDDIETLAQGEDELDEDQDDDALDEDDDEEEEDEDDDEVPDTNDGTDQEEDARESTN